MAWAKNRVWGKYLLWVLLAVPAMGMSIGFLSGNADGEKLLHPSGEFSTRMMIIAMLATPLLMLFKDLKWSVKVPAWLMRHRRAFGVGAFGYAILHTLFYIESIGTWDKFTSDLVELGIWTGWLAFLIFIPLGVTSNNASQRLLRSSWKKLQRWVYAAALLTLVHWIFVENNVEPALVHFVPLALLEAYRVYKQYFSNAKNKNSNNKDANNIETNNSNAELL